MPEAPYDSAELAEVDPSQWEDTDPPWPDDVDIDRAAQRSSANTRSRGWVPTETLRWRNMPAQTACTSCRQGGPGIEALMAYWLESFPGVARNLATYACRIIAGTNNLSQHGCHRAADTGHPVTRAAHQAMYTFLQRLAPHAGRLAIPTVIFDGWYWSWRSGAAGAPYRGVYPHHDHAHIELTPTAAQTLTVRTLRSVVGDFRPPTGDEDMAAAVEGIQRALNTAGIPDQDGNPLVVDGKWGPRTEHAFTTQSRASARHLVSVQGVQTELNGAGYTDDAGRRLAVDGWWGARTQQAYAKMLAAKGLTEAVGDARYARLGQVVAVTGQARL
jgi:hypothetical protein